MVLKVHYLLRIFLLWGNYIVSRSLCIHRIDCVVIVAVAVVLVVVITLDTSFDIVSDLLSFLGDVGHLGGLVVVDNCGCLEDDALAKVVDC